MRNQYAAGGGGGYRMFADVLRAQVDAFIMRAIFARLSATGC